MPENSVTVRLDRRLGAAFAVVGAVIGFGAGFALDPVVDWLLERAGGAPAPLRLVSQLPLAGEVALMTVAGLVAGLVLFAVWSDEVSEVTVSADELLITSGKHAIRLGREEVHQVFLDKDQLVVTGENGRELVRTGSDGAVTGRLQAALERFQYPWAGRTHPWEAEFVTWVDRSADLDEREHALLRARRRALADDRTGAAEEARDSLAELGLVVRDREKEQQYRRL